MNRKWILFAIAVAAAGLVAFGITRYAVSRASSPSLDRLQDVSFLSRELNLTAAQVIQVKALHLELGVKLNDCCVRHCAVRARLGQALAGETNGEERTEAILKEMSYAYEQSERVTLDHIRHVRALLSADQRQRFDKLISACLCGPCSMTGNGMETSDDKAGDE